MPDRVKRILKMNRAIELREEIMGLCISRHWEDKVKQLIVYNSVHEETIESLAVISGNRVSVKWLEYQMKYREKFIERMFRLSPYDTQLVA